MRVPLSWIREFTPIDVAPADIADALNQLGLEVEAIDEPGRDIHGVVVARIIDVVPHPDADRIRLADVEYGDGQLRVVCGAPNIEPGMVVPFARVGAVLPGDFTIERRKIRGVVSEGMLCSPRELGLGDDHGGILALPADAPLGTDVREVLGLDDVVFDLSITPNRPDAMGVVGVARELAAHFDLPFHVDEREPAPLVEDLDGARVIVEATDRCPRFVGMVARVQMGESPAWMQRRLMLAGMRPISNVVDITNYVMLERCRPLHAFDLGKLAGRGIVVRCAADGEKMTTLDGVERALTRDDLLICDAERNPQAIAGIMGGAAAEVSGTTAEILLESGVLRTAGDCEDGQAARAPLGGERPVRARRRSEQCRHRRAACDGAAGRLRGRATGAGSNRRLPGADRAQAHLRADRARQPAARHGARRRRDRRVSHTPRHRCARRHRSRPHVSTGSDTRDRSRRGSCAAHRTRSHRAHRAVESREDRWVEPAATRPAHRYRRVCRCGIRRDLHVAARRAGRPRACRCRCRRRDRSRESLALRGVDPAARTSPRRVAGGRVQRGPRHARRRALRDRHGVRRPRDGCAAARGTLSSCVRAHSHGAARAPRAQPPCRRVRRGGGAARVGRRAARRRRAPGIRHHRRLPSCPGSSPSGGRHARRTHR